MRPQHPQEMLHGLQLRLAAQYAQKCLGDKTLVRGDRFERCLGIVRTVLRHGFRTQAICEAGVEEVPGDAVHRQIEIPGADASITDSPVIPEKKNSDWESGYA